MLPFHVPFVLVTNHIRNDLLNAASGEPIEEAFVDEFAQVDKDAVAQYRALDTSSAASVSNRNGGTGDSTGSYGSAAKDCFIVLQREAEARARLHARCTELLRDAREVERDGRESLAPATKKVREHALSALESITRTSDVVLQHAKNVRALLQASVVERIGATVEQIAADTLAIEQLEQRAAQNRLRQEKAVRSMREQVKGLVKLQAEHRGIADEIAAVYAKRVQSQVLVEGVQQVCATRCERLAAAEEACNHSATTAVSVRKQLEAALAQCQAHVSRVTSQEFLRCSRMAQRVVGNCANWYRCLGDLRAIRDTRLRLLTVRGDDGGWHVQFLQKQEVAAQQDGLGEIDRQRAHIEGLYVPLSRSVLALDVDCPSLKFVDAQDPETLRMRGIFLSVPDAGRERLLRDGSREVLSNSGLNCGVGGGAAHRNNSSMQSSLAGDGSGNFASSSALPLVSPRRGGGGASGVSNVIGSGASAYDDRATTAHSEIPSLPPLGALKNSAAATASTPAAPPMLAPEPPPRRR